MTSGGGVTGGLGGAGSSFTLINVSSSSERGRAPYPLFSCCSVSHPCSPYIHHLPPSSSPSALPSGGITFHRFLFLFFCILNNSPCIAFYDLKQICLEGFVCICSFHPSSNQLQWAFFLPLKTEKACPHHDSATTMLHSNISPNQQISASPPELPWASGLFPWLVPFVSSCAVLYIFGWWIIRCSKSWDVVLYPILL